MASTYRWLPSTRAQATDQPSRALSARHTTLAILSLALVQGLIYLVLLPPWQHYDEPTHFEYAWLIANRTALPQPGDEDQTMQREVAASMLEHRFYWNLPQPDLLTDDGEIGIGYSELGHPPLYYVLVSLPLRLVSYLDVATQLYIARSVSLLLFVLTIGISIGIMRDLVPPGHTLRWLVPLSLVLLPPFVDVMTSVNNDVGAVVVFSLFTWGAVRISRYGLNRHRVVWIVGTALLAVLTKNTAAIAVLLAPLTIMGTLWVENRRHWRKLVAGCLVAAVLLIPLIFAWGDAAYWYHASGGSIQATPTSLATAAAPVGASALMLEAASNTQPRRLINPLLTHDVQQVTGRTVTFGGWLWANQPARVLPPQLNARPHNITGAPQPVDITTTPRFVAWNLDVPEQTQALQYVLSPPGAKAEAPSLQVFLDGAFVVEGSFPTDVTPRFDDADGRTGQWAGQRFTNVLRNGSAEQTWPRVRPWFENGFAQHIRRSPVQLLAALCDAERTMPLLHRSASIAFGGFFNGFAWGHVRLAHRWWLTGIYLGAAVSLLGCIRKLVGLRTADSRTLALGLLGFSIVFAWANTIIRPLPVLEGGFIIPATRYAFPAIIPTMVALCGGWLAWWPRRFRGYTAGFLVSCLFVLNAFSIWTIQRFYQSL